MPVLPTRLSLREIREAQVSQSDSTDATEAASSSSSSGVQEPIGSGVQEHIKEDADSKTTDEVESATDEDDSATAEALVAEVLIAHGFGPDPANRSEARARPDAKEWIIAELNEWNSLKQHKVYTRPRKL